MRKRIMYVDGNQSNGKWTPVSVLDEHETYRISSYSVGRHNICGKRWDMWWTDKFGQRWHGVHMGDFNTVVHCRRTNKTTI